MRPAGAAAALLLAWAACASSLAADPVSGAAGAPSARGEARPAGEVARENPASEGRVTVYYFHRTIRCHTCLGMEAAAREAVYGDFADDLNAGRVEWRSVDFELPEDAHFEKEFGLEGSSLVFAETSGKKVVRWEKIEGMWSYAGQPGELKPFVGKELRRFLGRGAGEGSPAGEAAGDSAAIVPADSAVPAGGNP